MFDDLGIPEVAYKTRSFSDRLPKNQTVISVLQDGISYEPVGAYRLISGFSLSFDGLVVDARLQNAADLPGTVEEGQVLNVDYQLKLDEGELAVVNIVLKARKDGDFSVDKAESHESEIYHEIITAMNAWVWNQAGLFWGEKNAFIAGQPMLIEPVYGARTAEEPYEAEGMESFDKLIEHLKEEGVVSVDTPGRPTYVGIDDAEEHLKQAGCDWFYATLFTTGADFKSKRRFYILTQRTSGDALPHPAYYVYERIEGDGSEGAQLKKLSQIEIKGYSEIGMRLMPAAVAGKDQDHFRLLVQHTHDEGQLWLYDLLTGEQLPLSEEAGSLAMNRNTDIHIDKRQGIFWWFDPQAEKAIDVRSLVNGEAVEMGRSPEEVHAGARDKRRMIDRVFFEAISQMAGEYGIEIEEHQAWTEILQDFWLYAMESLGRTREDLIRQWMRFLLLYFQGCIRKSV